MPLKRIHNHSFGIYSAWVLDSKANQKETLIKPNSPLESVRPLVPRCLRKSKAYHVFLCGSLHVSNTCLQERPRLNGSSWDSHLLFLWHFAPLYSHSVSWGWDLYVHIEYGVSLWFKQHTKIFLLNPLHEGAGGWVWWYESLVPTLKSWKVLRQEDWQFKASLDYMWRGRRGG